MTSTSQTPPTGSWTISCGGSWTSTDLSIANAPSCPPGKQPSSSTTCTECTEGKYSDSDDTYSCTPCGIDYYNPATGSTSSSACLACVEPDFTRDEAAAVCITPGVKPPPVFVQGSCLSVLNGLWEPEAETASGRWWYLNSDTQYTLYWDASCDGAGTYPSEWVFDSSVPSVTAESDLDGELFCRTA